MAPFTHPSSPPLCLQAPPLVRGRPETQKPAARAPPPTTPSSPKSPAHPIPPPPHPTPAGQPRAGRGAFKAEAAAGAASWRAQGPGRDRPGARAGAGGGGPGPGGGAAGGRVRRPRRAAIARWAPAGGLGPPLPEAAALRAPRSAGQLRAAGPVDVRTRRCCCRCCPGRPSRPARPRPARPGPSQPCPARPASGTLAAPRPRSPARPPAGLAPARPEMQTFLKGKRVGYWLSEKKIKKLNFQAFAELCRYGSWPAPGFGVWGKPACGSPAAQGVCGSGARGSPPRHPVRARLEGPVDS